MLSIVLVEVDLNGPNEGEALVLELQFPNTAELLFDLQYKTLTDKVHIIHRPGRSRWLHHRNLFINYL